MSRKYNVDEQSIVDIDQQNTREKMDRRDVEVARLKWQARADHTISTDIDDALRQTAQAETVRKIPNQDGKTNRPGGV